MKNNVNIKYMIYMILTILGILALTRLYVYYTVDDIDEVKPVGKIENVEVQDVENDEKIETVVETKKNKVIKKTEIKKTVKKDLNSTKDIVYKNSPENEGINMVLEVPEKWSHLDYSRLGQPKEVALKEHPVEVDYLDAKTEKKLLNLYLNEDFKNLISKFYDDEVMLKHHEYEQEIVEDDNKTEYVDRDSFFSDINNFIYVDEKTGRKEVSGKIHVFFDFFCGGAAYQTGCFGYEKQGENLVTESLTKEEFYEFGKYFENYLELIRCDYWNRCGDKKQLNPFDDDYDVIDDNVVIIDEIRN